MDPTPPPATPIAEPLPPAEAIPIVSPPAPQYEFTAEQNKVIVDLSDSMYWVSMPLLFLGMLFTLTGLLNIAGAVVGLVRGESRPEALANAGIGLLAAVLVSFLAIRTQAAADRFKAIADTAGKDITHLMSGLASLGRMFGVLRTMVQVYILFVLVMLVMTAIAWGVQWFRGEPTG